MIRLENLSKYYYSSNVVVPALRKINLELHIGEFVAITGESGSGKSTLLNIISGQDTYDDGELLINGEETSYYDEADWEEYRKNKIGFIFQNYNLIENYSALYNVESSLLIQGYSNKEARKVAKELLNKVGLGGKSKQRAVNLSSGQKQRLSIARALAKNTNVIVADEPTGNLDSENGKQIMELLSDLSKDRLIIVVTHNFEEAEPFVSRKIRLHDGEIVADTPVNHESEDETVIKKDTVIKQTSERNNDTEDKVVSSDVDNSKADDRKTPASFERKVISDRKTAWSFAWMNITTQPRQVILFMTILLVTAAVSFIFLGEIYSNWDDTFTKKYKDSAFCNRDTTRIVVKKPDCSAITDEDMKLFGGIKYVKAADKYGFSNDINYYFKPKEDYDYIYKSIDSLSSTDKEKSVDFINKDHFIKSSTCITEKDLSIGTLPQSRNEIVVYSEDKKVLGKEQNCFFTSKNIWGFDSYYSTQVKIVGILKKKCDQIYFSGELCNMLSVDLYGDDYNLSIGSEKFSLIPVIADDIEFKDDFIQLRLSEQLVLTDDSKAAKIGTLKVYAGDKDDGGKEKNSKKVAIDSKYNTHTAFFAEMNEKSFYQIFSYESRQASLYIKDYINTDYVLRKLTDKGYNAISSFRMSSIVYDDEKVAKRTNILVKSIIVLIIVSIFEIIIIRSIFRIRRKSFLILGSMGMSRKTITLMNCYEILLYTLASVLVVPLTTKIISLSGSHYMVNMQKYYNVLTSAIYIAFNFFVIAILILLLDRNLKHNKKWSS